MNDELEENTAQSFDLERYLGIVRRRHMLFLILLLVVWAAVWGSSWILPARYKSTTLILVEEPTMPKNYVIPNVNDNIQDRLQSITQQILSRTRLLLIIDKLHLYQDTRKAMTPDERVVRMRKDISIELVRDEKQAITAFKVNFSAHDPHIAQQVTSELTNLFIDENLKAREQQSENTTHFIETQLANARAGLADQEARIREFQTAHEGELPTQQATNLQILSGLTSQLQSEQDALNTARQQSAYHESMLEQYRTMSAASHYNATGAPTGAAGLEAIDEQLGKLRARLQDLTSEYTDRYPEVKRVKAEIAAKEKDREKAAASLKKEPETKQPNSNSQALLQSAPALQMQSQYQADQVEIANRQRAISSLEARINQYQGLLSKEPAVSQQLADLTRGYEQSQANYNDLLKKESDSQMATSMEQMQEGERFTMLDPPSLPLRPDFPNRLKMCGAGLGAGLGLGVLVVGLLEFFDDRLHTNKQITALIPVAVISEIPQITDPADVKREKWKAVQGWATAAVVLLVILSGSAFSYLHS